ncbi:MAG: sulfatase-like hydrolase/transferase [Planctomycetaceae bacterium]|nr:sulfatase-like hydrolase/transferase [Planctomycetaceae bacterium]
MCLCPGSGGWSEPRPAQALKDDALYPVQLFDLATDPAEERNVAADHRDRVEQMAGLLAAAIQRGRTTPGPEQTNEGFPNTTPDAVIRLLPVLSQEARPRKKVGKRPNIVFAFADDLGRYASAYRDPSLPSANDVIQTPYFDRVASEGTLFLNAFVSAPSCTPSRAAIVSGRHFFRNGSHSQLHHPWYGKADDPWAEVTGFPLMLQQAGYHIGWSYKMHISEDRMGGRERNYKAAGSRFNSFSQNAMKADDHEAAKAELLDEVRQNFNAFLADRQEDQPFYYWFNPTNTHRAWVQGSGQTLWGIDPDHLKGRLPTFLPDEPLIREDFADYLGEAMAFDAAVGVLLSELEARGELDNTIVVFSGDHGAPGFPRGKCNLYDFGTNVSLAARWGNGKIPAGRVVDDFVNLMDLAPTFLEAGGVTPPEVMTGRSLMPVLTSEKSGQVDPERTWVITGRERHVGDARPGGKPYPQRAFRTKDHVFIVNFEPDRWPMGDPGDAAGEDIPDYDTLANNTFAAYADFDASPTKAWMIEHRNDPEVAKLFELGFGKRPKYELYDLSKDADEIENVAGYTEYADVQADMEKRLMAELKRVNDPRVTADPVPFENAPFTDIPPRKKPKKK